MSTPNPGTALTMSDLAKAAGVSKMTVSLALRGHAKISAATRDRIRALAEKMGYRPNPLVQTLMANLRSTRPANYHSTIAWVTAFPTRDGWSSHCVHRHYHQGAVSHAAALGYKIETFWALAPRMTGAALTRMLRARGIRGVIIPPVADPGTRLDIDWTHFSCATIGYSFTEPRLHRAAANLREGMTRALAECERRGFKRIGFALPAKTDARVNHSWLAGYLAWQQFIPKNNRLPPLIALSPLENHLPAWLKTHRPEVIISPNFEFLEWLPELGKRVPEDISLVTLSYPDDEDASVAHISGINQNNITIGEAAVDLVVSQLQHNDTGIPDHPRVMLIDGFWNEGTTLKSSAGAARRSPAQARARPR